MVRSRLSFLVLALVGSACTVCARREPEPPANSEPARLTIAFTAAQVGYLEPCGCSPDQRGGVGRAATAIDDIRKEGHPVLVLDGGDRFFPATPPSGELAQRQMLGQARTMAEATRLLGYDALVLTNRDASQRAFFEGERLPPLLDTGDTKQPGTKATIIKEFNGLRVGLFAVGSGPDAEQLVRTRGAELERQKVDLTVLVAYRSASDARALVPAAHQAGVDLILASRSDQPETQEAAAFDDSPPVLSPRARGEEVLRLDVSLAGPRTAPLVRVAGAADREAEMTAIRERMANLRRDIQALSPFDAIRKMKTDKVLELEGRLAQLAAAPPPAMPTDKNVYTFAFVPMTPQLAQRADVRALLDAGEKQLAAEALAFEQKSPTQCPAPQAGKATYVGDAKCIECHEEAVAFWKKTPHAHAYQTLVDKGKQYNVNCISCHVVGWAQPGGACSIAATEGKQNVQCESCHGPGSQHIEDGDTDKIALRVPETQCKTCHDHDNSPHFNDTTYRPQIIGPGHGQPLARKP